MIKMRGCPVDGGTGRRKESSIVLSKRPHISRTKQMRLLEQSLAVAEKKRKICSGKSWNEKNSNFAKINNGKYSDMEKIYQRKIIIGVDYTYKRYVRNIYGTWDVENPPKNIVVLLKKTYVSPDNINQDKQLTEIEEALIKGIDNICLRITNEYFDSKSTVFHSEPNIQLYDENETIKNIPNRSFTITIRNLHDGKEHTKTIKIHSGWFDNQFVNETELENVNTTVEVNTTVDIEKEINEIESI